MAFRTGLKKVAKKVAYRVALILIPVLPLLLSGILGNLAVVGYLALRYWHDGLPVHLAWKDAMYGAESLGIDFALFRPWRGYFSHSRRLLVPHPTDDHITALCKVSMYVEMITSSDYSGLGELGSPGLYNMDTMDPVSTTYRVNAYLKMCKEVYGNLPKDSQQRKILDRLTPELKVNVTTPFRLPFSDKLLREERMRRRLAARDRPSIRDKWKPTDQIPEYGHLYESTPIRPIREEHIDASEIAEAVRLGKVAVFDATKLLGKEIFNMSMPEIARLHADTAKSIPMYRQAGATASGGSGIDNLEEYAMRVEKWKAANAIRFPEYRPFFPQHITEKDQRDWQDAFRHPTRWLQVVGLFAGLLAVNPVEQFLRQVRSLGLQCAINTRRLPNLPMPKVEDALGNPDWLERAWTMLWLGPIEDCWHYDDPDNLLIGIYGDIWVTVFMLEDRDVMRAGGDRGCWAPVTPMPHRIDRQETPVQEQWLEGLPFIHIKLEPGMGVVVPSGAFHSVTMTDGDRILMNCFMQPKYKGLWDAPAAKYSFYSSKYQSEDYAAIAHLKKSSIYRLWDRYELGGYFEGSKLEML